MAFDRFRGPVRRTRAGYALHLGDDEVQLLDRLLDELSDLLRAEDADAAMTRRLFPTAHPDEPELEAEYQRLMRPELVASRLASIEEVRAALAPGAKLDESALLAFTRSINSIRLVLGVLLDVGDDDAGPETSPELSDSPEAHLYAYLSWLLEWSIQALSGSVS